MTSNDTSAVEPLSISNCPSNCQSDTPNCILYGEIGRLPLEIRVKLRMISYWCKLVNNESKLSSSLYRLMLCLKNQGQNNFKWINYVESILNSAGLGYIFINQVGYCDTTYLSQILPISLSVHGIMTLKIHLEDNFMALSKKTLS